ncbi:MAG: hypothetical protein ACXVEF_35335 [Polyangiales bacterium]
MPGDTAPGAACPGALEKSTKKCNATCTYDADVCALPKGWTKIADPSASFTARTSTAAAWTGGEMFVFGGGTSETSPGLKDGALYRLNKNTWEVLPAVTVVSNGRKEAVGVWTGFYFIAWGGRDGSTFLNDGVEYDPSTKTWSKLPVSPLSVRSAPAAVWNPKDSRVVIWGGYDATTSLADGAEFDPITNTWTKLPAAPISGRTGHVMLWTGTEVLIWAGRAASGAVLGDGALYNPTTKVWRKLPTASIGARALPMGAMTASGALFFGGADYSLSDPQLWDGAIVSVGATPAWSALTPPGAAVVGKRTSPVWWATSTALTVWSGIDATASSFEITGASYDFASGTWTSSSTSGSPTGRIGPTVVAAGKCGLVWSGYSQPSGGVTELVSDGGIYCP